MMEQILQIGVSNACISVVLAVIAMVVGAKTKRSHLAHLLWLLVLVKLVTPPIMMIPVVTFFEQAETAVVKLSEADGLAPIALSSRTWGAAGASLLTPIWLLGSVVVLACSLVRVFRFHRLLTEASSIAPADLQAAAARISRRLGLKRMSTIHTTSACLSPMVWWIGGKVRVVMPAALLDKMDQRQWEWILAHELAHVRRRDYLVRWLEWLTCVCFWWNPVVWWAQRNLRAMEEICCDDLVISCLNPKPKLYADSLLSAVEFLACPALRPPAMASEMNSGGFLEKRFKMIVSDNSNRSKSRWLQACVLLCAIVVLPLGIVSAQDYDAVGKRLREAVTAGELSPDQARAMMDELRRAAQQDEGQSVDGKKWDDIKRRVEAAVKSGDITREEADAKYKEIKKLMAQKKKAGASKKKKLKAEDAKLEAYERKLKQAVANGEMTEDEAMAKWTALTKKDSAKSKAASKKKSKTGK